jgi:hypothetical protein
MVPWLTGPWVIDGVAGAVVLLGLALAAWGLFGNRLRRCGRDRAIPECPRCHYDLRGQPADRPRTCPECGHTAKSDRELYRGRRRWWPAVLGLIVFTLPSGGVLYIVVGWQGEQAALAEIGARHPAWTPNVKSEWVGPQWLSPRVPECLHPYGERVVLLGVGYIDDRDMPYVGRLTHLYGAFLQRTKLTDAGLVHLSGLTELEWLDLEAPGVTDAGLAHLSGLSELWCLRLVNRAVTDAGLVHMQGLTKLHTLCLYGTRVTDTGVAELRKHLPNATIMLR